MSSSVEAIAGPRPLNHRRPSFVGFPREIRIRTAGNWIAIGFMIRLLLVLVIHFSGTEGSRSLTKDAFLHDGVGLQMETHFRTKRMGYDLMREHRKLFEYWRQYNAGKIKWRTFQKNVRPTRKQDEALLLRGVYSNNLKLERFSLELHNHRANLWTLTKAKGVEPTNNTAERALRPAVTYRKLSFRTQKPCWQ